MTIVLDGGITEVPGFLAAGVRCGVKRRGLDLMVIASEDGPVPAAGAFTTNLVKGAPVLVTIKNLKKGKLGAIVANSGVSNVFTGAAGIRNARKMAQLTAQLPKVRPSNVAVASTGLIGAKLPMRRIETGIRSALKELSNSRESSLNAAKAIMTTDTMPKEIAIQIELKDGTPINIAGIAKGAGMIAPNMKTATMLAFVVTDIAITHDALSAALQAAVDKSFNMVNIDGDMSTSDMVIVMANGRAKNRRTTLERKDKEFWDGLEFVLRELAWMVAKDGEGATHLIEAHVKNAKNLEEAKRAARAVVGSNLVKAAVFGRDPNFGRVICALGYSGISFDESKLSLEFVSERGRIDLVKKGKPASKRAMERARDILRSREVEIHIDLAEGKARSTAWGCDLTYDYVKINSRYST